MLPDSDSDDPAPSIAYSLQGRDDFTSYSFTYHIGSPALKVFPECVLSPSDFDITYSMTQKDPVPQQVYIDWDPSKVEIRLYSEDILLHSTTLSLQITCYV